MLYLYLSVLAHDNLMAEREEKRGDNSWKITG
jgi:hypothetical protein